MKRWLNLLEVFYSVGSGGERTEKHLVTRVHLWCRSTYSTASLDVEKLIWCKSFAVSLICIFTSFKLTVLISPMLCWAGRTKNSSTFRRSKRHGWTKQISRHCNICRWNWQSLSKIKQWRFLPSSAEGCQLVSVQRHRHSEFDIRSDTLQAAFVPLLCKDEKCDGILGKIGEDYPTKAAKYVPISMEIAEKVFMPNVGKVDVKEAQRYKDYE